MADPNETRSDSVLHYGDRVLQQDIDYTVDPQRGIVFLPPVTPTQDSEE